MRLRGLALRIAVVLLPGLGALGVQALAGSWWGEPARPRVQLGPRPYYLVERMAPGPLQRRLASCAEREFEPSAFSIGHRGAPLAFPEHTRESYQAAARMGAGIIECDVTFTKDGELVCRHDQCDLHTTTDILLGELASTCEQPFTAAQFAPDGTLLAPASARCCSSALTLEQFKSLCAKMDTSERSARTPEEFQGGTPPFRSELYASCGTLLSHAESIELIRGLGARHTPELKEGRDADVDAIFGGQQQYARKLIDEYAAAGVPPRDVYPQSFDLDDVEYWVRHTAYGRRAVYLDGDTQIPKPNPRQFVAQLVSRGVRILAPPLPMLLSLDAAGKIAPSEYAREARRAGLQLIGWTIERSGRIREDVLASDGEFYYQSTRGALRGDGDIFTVIDVLARQVGVIGLFSDWPATTTYYAGCMGID